jgi:Holliday junction resolvase RusA-like endonuclease
MIKQKFFIDTVLPGANDVLRIHPQVYSRMKRDYGMLVRVAIRKARLKRMEWAEITFAWQEKPAEKNKRRDPDNIRFAAKFILDSLVHEQILEDDSIGFVVGLRDRYVIESAQPGVWVELEGKLTPGA